LRVCFCGRPRLEVIPRRLSAASRDVAKRAAADGRKKQKNGPWQQDVAAGSSREADQTGIMAGGLISNFVPRHVHGSLAAGANNYFRHPVRLISKVVVCYESRRLAH